MTTKKILFAILIDNSAMANGKQIMANKFNFWDSPAFKEILISLLI